MRCSNVKCKSSVATIYTYNLHINRRKKKSPHNSFFLMKIDRLNWKPHKVGVHTNVYQFNTILYNVNYTPKSQDLTDLDNKFDRYQLWKCI